MRKKPSLLLLFTVILTLLFLFTACDGAGVTGPDSQSPAAPPEQTPGDETAGPASDPYPPPEEPAAEVQESQPEPYPAPGENIDAASAQPYPPPSGENATQAGEAYPAAENQSYPGPEGSTEEPGPAPNTLLGPAQSEATLTGRVWRFDQFSNPAGQTILPSLGGFESNSVEFFEDGRVIINAGCNTAQGAYAVSDGSINIQALNETQEICQGPSLGDQFLQWLNEAAAYRLQNGKLFLTLPGESGEMQLSGNNILTYADRITKILVLTAGLGLPQAQPETLEALMDTSLDELLYHEGDSPQAARGKSPGAVVLIQSPAGAMAKAAGFADVAEQKPMSTYDRLEIGSNTVMFTAVLLAQLQEEGLLSLDDPLSKWLPDLSASIPNGSEITLRQLATHTAGVADYGGPLIGAGAADSEALRSSYTPEELVRLATENLPPDFAPGEPGQWRFSNTGYILLGLVLEAAAGQSYADLLQARIFGPLGMVNSELLEGIPYQDSIADGYLAYPYDKKTTEWNGSQGWAAGGIISTAADMAKFARALMTGALFNDPQTLDLMTDFIAVSDNEALGSMGGTGYGLGLIEFAPGLWGHRGQTIGFTSIVAMDPAKDFILIALTNSAEGTMGKEQPLMGHYLQLDQ